MSTPNPRLFLALCAAALLLTITPTGANAARPVEHTGVSTLAPDETIETTRAGMVRARRDTGQPVALYNPAFRVRQGTPEAMAREYLSSFANSICKMPRSET